MNCYVIIVAGGKGSRMKSSVPKQFLTIHNKPILQYTLEAFYKSSLNIEIILVLPKEHVAIWKDICQQNCINIPHKICIGGAERFFSVKNGLGEINENGVVGIHDGVRPLVNSETIEKLYRTASENGSAIPYIKVKESVREIGNNGSAVLDRDRIALIQTPQCFHIDKIKEAYKQEFNASFTDDASVFEAAFGKVVTLVEGNQENIKITTPIDLKIAEALLS